MKSGAEHTRKVNQEFTLRNEKKLLSRAVPHGVPLQHKALFVIANIIGSILPGIFRRRSTTSTTLPAQLSELADACCRGNAWWRACFWMSRNNLRGRTQGKA